MWVPWKKTVFWYGLLGTCPTSHLSSEKYQFSTKCCLLVKQKNGIPFLAYDPQIHNKSLVLVKHPNWWVTYYISIFLVGGDLCPSTHMVPMLPGLHISWRSAACEEATAPATWLGEAAKLRRDQNSNDWMITAWVKWGIWPTFDPPTGSKWDVWNVLPVEQWCQKKEASMDPILL